MDMILPKDCIHFFSVFASHIGHIARYAPFSRNDLSYSTSSPLSSVLSPINTMRSIILAINVVNVKAPITRLTRLPLAPDIIIEKIDHTISIPVVIKIFIRHPLRLNPTSCNLCAITEREAGVEAIAPPTSISFNISCPSDSNV